MSKPDLNLLVALEALLTEGSVTGAADRLGRSPSAMSRALARLRETTGDPLLVRAGRGLVPTPRAAELRSEIGPLVRAAEAMLRPVEPLDLEVLERTFTLRSREGFAETFGPALLDQIGSEAPRVQLRFERKPRRSDAAMRTGAVDFETGVVKPQMEPELRAQRLFQDQFVGVIRSGHPLSRGTMTRDQYQSGRHVAVLRSKSDGQGPFGRALEKASLKRNIVTVVGEFSTALALARKSDLIATVPEQHTAGLRDGMHVFPLPMPTPEVTISLLWHPRLNADPAHRWLRECIQRSCDIQLSAASTDEDANA